MTSAQTTLPAPISAMPSERLRNVIGVITDVDDTLTRDGVIEADAFAALHALRAAGLMTIAVTGRPAGWAEVLAQLGPFDLALGENGSTWFWSSPKGLQTGYFDDEATRAEQSKRMDMVRAAVAERFPEIRESSDSALRRHDIAYDVFETVQRPHEEVAALIRCMAECGVHTTLSSVHAHGIPGDWDKALGLERALEERFGLELTADDDRFVFIGDSGNDASAFRRFPLSVGVANVREHLATLAASPKFVTQADRGLGFAELAHMILRARQSA